MPKWLVSLCDPNVVSWLFFQNGIIVSIARNQHSLVDLDLAKFADVADALATKTLEVGGNTATLKIDDACSRLVHKRSNGGDGVATHTLGSKSVDHGLQTHVGFASADDFSLCGIECMEQQCEPDRSRQSCPEHDVMCTYDIAGVVGLDNGDFDALVGKVALGKARMKVRFIVTRAISS